MRLCTLRKSARVFWIPAALVFKTGGMTEQG